MLTLTEDLTKAFLSDMGLPVPQGSAFDVSTEAALYAETFDDGAVIKALVPTGRRGKAGAVILTETFEEASTAADRLLGAEVQGFVVEKIYVERRVEIARALALKPKFLLLDEPFAGIDPISVMDIQKIIEQLAKDEIGILITDHNVRETLKICDNAYVINSGEVLASGKPKNLIKNDIVKKVYLGQSFKL